MQLPIHRCSRKPLLIQSSSCASMFSFGTANSRTLSDGFFDSDMGSPHRPGATTTRCSRRTFRRSWGHPGHRSLRTIQRITSPSPYTRRRTGWSGPHLSLSQQKGPLQTNPGTGPHSPLSSNPTIHWAPAGGITYGSTLQGVSLFAPP